MDARRRLISEDPARDGNNWYAYVGNNPISFTDPTGLIILRGPGGVIYDTSASGQGVAPLSGEYKVSGPFGGKFNAGSRAEFVDTHAGVDLVSATRRVQASKAGTVLFAGTGPYGSEKGTGVLVVVENTDGTTSLYGHLDSKSISVAPGDRVSAGVGMADYADPTVGRSSDPHLHYEEFVGLNVDRSGSDLASDLYSTGYFYDQNAVPESHKVVNSNDEEIEVRNPEGDWEIK